MALEVSLREHSANLASVRAPERKRSAEAIKQFLSRSAVPSLLTENTLKSKGFTWNNLFCAIQEYIIKETEKFETSKTYENVTAPLCSTLLHLCVSGANKGQSFIKTEKITEACIFFLKDKRLSKAIGDAYVSLLCKHVLPCSHHVNYITANTWEELLDISISTSLASYLKVDECTRLKLILQVLNNASHCCQFNVPMRNCLPRLKKCFQRANTNDSKVLEAIIQIITLILETISTEYRMTVCDFIESTLHSMLKFYDQNLDVNKKMVLFKLLKLTVSIHHPNGRLESEEGSFASDWVVWYKHLHNIMEIICLEVMYRQKSRFGLLTQTYRAPCKYFDELSATVSYQIFNIHSALEVNEDEAGRSAKRPKLTINKYYSFKDLVKELERTPEHWIGIVHMYIGKFSHTISGDEYLSLLGTIENVVMNINNAQNWHLDLEEMFSNLSSSVITNVTTSRDIKTETLESSLLSLWNSCVRALCQNRRGHMSLHHIMRKILTLDLIKYEHVQPLIKLYYEQAIEVSNSGVQTVIYVFHNFFTKYSYISERKHILDWLIHGPITSVEIGLLKGIMLRLISIDNIAIETTITSYDSIKNDTHFQSDKRLNKLHKIIFETVEECILFNEFEYEVINNFSSYENKFDNIQVSEEMCKNMRDYLKENVREQINKLVDKKIELSQFIKWTRVILTYVNLLLELNVFNEKSIVRNEIYLLFKEAMSLVYVHTACVLKESNKDDQEKCVVLSQLENILMEEYAPFLSAQIRSCVDKNLFFVIHGMLNTEIDETTDDICDDQYHPYMLKHIGFCVLAAYCKKSNDYFEELISLILDPKIYDFTNSWSVKNSIRCIEILIDENVDQSPLEEIFFLMQHMCKALFRNSETTYKILKIVLKLLEKIWCNEIMKQNCLIMIKSYLQLCEMMFYPPKVAALLFECVSRIDVIERNQNVANDNFFKDVLITSLKGNTHSIRLYCCYLLTNIIDPMSDKDIHTFLEELMDIFSINLSEVSELMLRDEAANRTLTVLHCIYTLALQKKSLVLNIIKEFLQLQEKKSVEKQLTKKVLNKITTIVFSKSIEVYLNDNILPLINFWFSKNYALTDLPLYLFGFETFDTFLETHACWLIPADILRSKQGTVDENDTVLKLIQTKFKKTQEHIVEMCFCHTIILCLPYIVVTKHQFEERNTERYYNFKEISASAEKTFQKMRLLIDDVKWSNLFVENMGELLLYTAAHMKDRDDACLLFSVDLPEYNEPTYYTKYVFEAMLNYYEKLISCNILQYLCEKFPLTIFKILFKLWENVLQEKVFEHKVFSVHTFLVFVQKIPLGLPSDTMICNFVCNSLTSAIKNCENGKELQVFVKALNIALIEYLPGKINELRKSIFRLLVVLIVKKEEGFESKCTPLMEYLTVDMKEYLNESQDIVDFISKSSQGVAVEKCATKLSFIRKLKNYKLNLCCPSHETLRSLWQFLVMNKNFVNVLCEDNNEYSEGSEIGICHDVINALTDIMKTACDNKTKIECVNCLSEIGTYNLRTLVIVPPGDTQKIVDLLPEQHMAYIVIMALTQVVFEDSPITANQVTKALSKLLKFSEGKDILDLYPENKKLLEVFISTGNMRSANFKIDLMKFETYHTTFKVMNADESYLDWLKRVSTSLMNIFDLTDNYIKELYTVCVLKPSVCQSILPSLVGLILHCSSEKQVQVISAHMNEIFNYIWCRTHDEVALENTEETTCRKIRSNIFTQDLKQIVQTLLDIVNFVFLQKCHYRSRTGRKIETLNYLKLDYNKVAWAATIAHEHITAIFYAELWAMASNDCVPPSSPEATTQIPGGDNLQKILRKCYVAIGEIEALDGCGIAHLSNEEEKRKHLINTGQFNDALLLHDIALSNSNLLNYDLQYGVIKSLHKSGMHRLALQYIRSLPDKDEINDIKYDCLALLGDWSVIVDPRELEEKCKQPNANIESTIKAFRYACLKDCLNLNISEKFECRIIPSLNRTKVAISELCKTLNMENCQNVYKVVGLVHLTSDIEDLFALRSDRLSMTELLNRWSLDRLPPFNDFKHLESIIAQRNLLLEYASKTHDNSLQHISSLQLQYTELTLTNNKIPLAQRILASVKKLQTSRQIDLMEAQISWAKGHKDIALSLLGDIVSNPTQDVRMTAISLRQYGSWMAESKCDTARNIIDKYLKKSLEMLKSSDHMATRLKVYRDIAKFADDEYKQVVSYMNSSVYENKLRCMEKMKDVATNLKSTPELSKDDKRTLVTSARFSALDEAEIANTKTEKETFLQLAMRYYLLSLEQSEENNLSVFRVISLWFDNPAIEFSETGTSFEDLLNAIPSRKFITALPQLAPRLTNENTPFAVNLKKIIKKCATEHPHHTLPILFSLKNSDKDQLILNASCPRQSGRSTQRDRSQPPEPRVAAAEKIIKELHKDNAVLAVIISQMEKLCDATISLANYVPQTKDNKQKIPAAESLHKLRNLDAIPIPVITIPVRHDCDYTRINTLVSFDDYFELVGGINCPKKINCRGSNGEKKTMLVKGKDDLRQDAVMQQVFAIVNTLLEKDPITNRHKLLIRTYKVVPMSKRSGVLEWCEGTLPLGAYLLGPNGAHARYRPQDISCNAARMKLTNCHENKKPNSVKLAVFTKILENLKPVFHYFFTEHYLDPVTWFERRLAYTKSVATSSMVGYIMGLGDRHVQNILIDQKTAEVIHIDFGVAFDQGKTLPTPETIPFRLTQDIIAGFGCSGVEGVFRKCCEKTMQLLRDNQETLLTILEVLLCDPLYSWIVSTPQQNAISATPRNTSVHQGSKGGLAERALLAVRSKLNGTEGGVAGGVAVPGQVAHLINCATDLANLCRLYPGWQPYL